jgi:hypothetical protein
MESPIFHICESSCAELQILHTHSLLHLVPIFEIILSNLCPA